MSNQADRIIEQMQVDGLTLEMTTDTEAYLFSGNTEWRVNRRSGSVASRCWREATGKHTRWLRCCWDTERMIAAEARRQAAYKAGNRKHPLPISGKE